MRSRRPNRRVIGVAILTAWLGIVAWHVRREYVVPPSTRLAAGARALAPGAHWYVVRMDGVPIGIAQSSLDTVPEGFVFVDDITLDVPVLGRLQRSRAQSRIELGQALELRAFRFALDSEIGSFAVRGPAAVEHEGE